MMSFDKIKNRFEQSLLVNSSLDECEIQEVVSRSKEIFLAQPMLLELNSPVRIVGSVLGHLKDIQKILDIQLDNTNCKLIFMGDYIDRSVESIETMFLLLSCKIQYPEQIFLLRGCQETCQMSRGCGFFDACKNRYQENIWEIFVDCFNCMPVAATVDKKMFLSHGGISPELTSLDQIANITRPTDVLDRGILCDLLWSEPSQDVQGWEEKEQGVSSYFGLDVVNIFLKNFDLYCAIRSHQHVSQGYDFFGDRKQIITIFSAQNFRNSENFAAVLDVKEDLVCSFKLLIPDGYLSTETFKINKKMIKS